MMRRVLVVCASLALGVRSAGVAQDIVRQPVGNAHPELAATGEKSYEPGAFLMRKLIKLDLDNATVGEALREVSRQLGGRLMFDEATNALDARVDLNESEITVGKALEKILSGTDLQISSTNRGGVILVKHPQPAVQAQDSVTIRGRVIDEATGEAIPEVVVTVDTRREYVVTDRNGNFIMTRVPAGQRVLTFRRVGFSQTTMNVDLTAGRDTSLVVQLTLQPIRIGEIVSTATGEQRRLEIGHSIAGIRDVDSVMQITPVTSMSQLIANRIPGLHALTNTGAVGSPTRLRVRGVSSIESNNEPVIVIDGIVMSNTAATRTTNSIYGGVYGGNRQVGANDLSMRLDDLDPNMIESVEVMKGPAASTMYGAEAANGVIVITTKKGHAGPARWNFYTDYRQMAQVKDYEYPVQALGTNLRGGVSSATGLNCTLSGIYTGSCIPTGEFLGFNMLQDPLFTPQARGYTKTFGANVMGGNDGLTYFIGGTFTDQLGTSKMPEINQRWIERGRGAKIKEELVRPNALRKAGLNARVTGRLGSTADFSLGASFNSLTQRVGADGMSGLMAAPRLESDTTPIMTGWESWYGKREQNVKHIIGNASANWRPNWLGNAFYLNITYGWDFSLRDDEYYAPKGSCHPLCAASNEQGILGYINTGRRSDFSQSLNIRTAFTYPLASWVTSSTRLGGNYRNLKIYDLYSSADNLRVGVKLYAPSGTIRSTQLGDNRVMAGWFLEQQFNLRQDRFFVTVGMRQDASSTIGETEKPVFPKWNFSWLASEEDFFPFRDQIDLFRIRFATGRAGVLPATTARNRTYAMASNFVLDDGSPTGFFAELGSPGDPNLRAELSKEYEGGFDIELLNRRLLIDMTWFKKYTKDAIHRSPTAPSVGASVVRALLGNLGDVENSGFELESTLRVIDNPNFSYDLTGSLTRRGNKLTRLADGVVTFISVNASGDLYRGNETRLAEGYSLHSRWAYPILGWADRNGDGMIDPTEVMVGDSLEYVGPNEPKYTGYIGNQITLLDRKLRIAANFAWQSGMVQFNQARRNMYTYTPAQQGLESSLRDQACVVATTAYTVTGRGTRRATDWCYMETIKLLRWQNLAVSYQLPQNLLRHIGAQSASLNFSVNNLHLWTNYKGRDPMVNTEAVSGNAVIAGPAFGAPRDYGIRLNVTF